MRHIRRLMTDDMITEYKVAITAGVVQIIFESGVKSQKDYEISLYSSSSNIYGNEVTNTIDPGT